jgi:chlorite dismutase
MPEPVETLEGWYALHDFRRINWTRWWQLTDDERNKRIDALEQWADHWYAKNRENSAGFGIYQIVGHKADLLCLYFCPSLDDLSKSRRYFDSPLWAGLMEPAWSYLSVVELSQYQAKGEDPSSPYLKARLFPSVPNSLYVSFYPMSKRRQGDDNWYMMTQAERRELMKSHGMIGHHHRQHVRQIITGSQGLDDWEWGVTLFADDAVRFKKIVYEMRFDESTARFGEFGTFYTGIRLESQALADYLRA